MAQLKNTTITGTLDITSNLTTTSGNITSTTGVLSMGSDTDTTNILGRAKIGYDGTNSDTVMFAHYDNATPENAGYRQLATGQSVFNAKTGTSVSLRINNSAKLTVDTSISVASGNTLQFTSGSAGTQNFGITRRTSSAVGNDLNIYSGGAYSTGSNLDGGKLLLSSGISTGSGMTSTIIKRYTRDASASTDNTQTDALVITSEKTLVDNTATSLFEVSLPSNSVAGGTIEYTVSATDGTDFQAHTGTVWYSACNKSGVYTTAISDESNADSANISSSGTLSETWSILTGTNKITIQANFNSSLSTPTIKMYYFIHNGSVQTITQL
jgi:hypothetical protein